MHNIGPLVYLLKLEKCEFSSWTGHASFFSVVFKHIFHVTLRKDWQLKFLLNYDCVEIWPCSRTCCLPRNRSVEERSDRFLENHSVVAKVLPRSAVER